MEACSASGADGNSVVYFKKLQSMVSDHYTLILVFIVCLVIGILVAIYFVKSIKNTLSAYLKNKTKRAKTYAPTNNQRSKDDDDYIYYENVNEDPEPIIPKDRLPKGEVEFIEKVDDVYNEYNTLKSQYLQKAYRKSNANEDIIDHKIKFNKYDRYRYDDDDEDY